MREIPLWLLFATQVLVSGGKAINKPSLLVLAGLVGGLYRFLPLDALALRVQLVERSAYHRIYRGEQESLNQAKMVFK